MRDSGTIKFGTATKGKQRIKIIDAEGTAYAFRGNVCRNFGFADLPSCRGGVSPALTRRSYLTGGVFWLGTNMRSLLTLYLLASLVAVAVAVAGCQSHAEQHREAEAQRIAAEEDSSCKSYGLEFGTPEYADCRMRFVEMRATNEGAEATDASY